MKSLVFIGAFLVPLWVGTGVASAQVSIAPEELNAMLGAKHKVVVVDVRPAGQFFAGHIEGAVNVPLAETNTYKTSKKKTLVLYCGGTDCALSGKGAKILVDRGYKDVRVLAGGLPAWENKGFPVIPPAQSKTTERLKVARNASKLSAADLFKALPGTYMVIDVRPNNEFSAAHIKGAFNIPLEGLPGDAVAAFKGKTLVIYDRLPDRSAKAAGLLAENGFTVFELKGGLQVWAALGYPVEAVRAPVVK